MNNLKVTMLLINSKVNKQRIVTTNLTLQVESLDELNKVIRTLRKIDSVYEVNRKK